MEHTPSQEVEWVPQPEENFTGKAWMGVLSRAEDRVLNAITVMFEPGARTHWHSHPEGQVLYVIVRDRHGLEPSTGSDSASLPAM